MDIGSEYDNPDLINYKPEAIWTWHADIGEEVARRIISARTPTVFLIRNIYDLLVSQYYHFKLDIDSEIGHPTGTRKVFDRLSQSEGISVVINGTRSDQFTWGGFGQELRRLRDYIQWYRIVGGHLISFDNLVQNKDGECS